MIILDKNVTGSCTIFMDGLNFLRSYWQIFRVNLRMTNSESTLLRLDVTYSVNVTVENSTFGFLIFTEVHNVVIENSSCSVTEAPAPSLRFHNSSGFIENLTIENFYFDQIFDGFIVQYYSSIEITKSSFINNTVNSEIISVLNSSRLAMSSCIMQTNKYGGAIYAKENSVAHLTSTYFIDNKAVNTGGAIYAVNNSSLRIISCAFQNNNVALDKSVQIQQGYGGAIYLENNSQAEIHHTDFTQNMATYGSAIYGYSSCIIACENCLLYHNTIPNNSDGAAIQIYYNSTLKLSNFKCNRQIGVLFSCISAFDNGCIFIYNSIFGMNTGSVISLFKNSSLITVNSSFFNNSSSESFGSIYSNNSTLEILDSKFHNNEAKMGGAIAIDKSELRIFESQFTSNYAAKGGSVLSNYSSLWIHDSVFENNTAGLLGGAISTFNLSCVTIENSPFINNSVPRERMFKWGIYSEYGSGGAISVARSTLKTYHSLFSKNYAHFQGGSVYSFASSLLMKGSLFENNIAGFFGGAIIGKGNSSLSIDNNNITHNYALDKTIGNEGNIYDYAGSGGGAILIFQSVLNISQSNFFDNFAHYQGGSVFASESFFVNSWVTVYK